ncbi:MULTISPECIES: DUF6881 domain-containing protein [unclassified Inquilinus]|uniref:DUF6881 domain-containing protein n=1 Tax=unclassified Inquilinus TaxID=2645927 RepID=UPI003F8F4187
MSYIRVQWVHSFPDEPVWLISELDGNRRETRKVEIFADGSKGYAAEGVEIGGTRLGFEAAPTLKEIGSAPPIPPRGDHKGGIRGDLARPYCDPLRAEHRSDVGFARREPNHALRRPSLYCHCPA